MTTITLDALGVGQWGQVAEVATEPVMRRRLLDLGLVPGTTVSCTAVSPAGDPAAYLIRGAVIALRRRDASCVRLAGAPWS
nr:FeoA family protein [uncultured Flavonifractor sp.]